VNNDCCLAKQDLLYHKRQIAQELITPKQFNATEKWRNQMKNSKTYDTFVQEYTDTDSIPNKTRRETALEYLRNFYPDNVQMIQETIKAIPEEALDIDCVRTFSQRLKYQMQKKSMTHVVLASNIGVSRQALEKYLPEDGEVYNEDTMNKTMDSRLLEAVSLLLEVSPLYLIGLVENPYVFLAKEDLCYHWFGDANAFARYLEICYQEGWVTREECEQILNNNGREDGLENFENDKVRIAIAYDGSSYSLNFYEKCCCPVRFEKDLTANNKTIKFLRLARKVQILESIDEYERELVKHVNERNWELFYMILSIGTKPKEAVDAIITELLKEDDIKKFVGRKIARSRKAGKELGFERSFERDKNLHKRPKVRKLSGMKVNGFSQKLDIPYWKERTVFHSDRFVFTNKDVFEAYMRYVLETLMIWCLPEDLDSISICRFFIYIMENDNISHRVTELIRNCKAFKVRKRAGFCVKVGTDKKTRAIHIEKAKMAKNPREPFSGMSYSTGRSFFNEVEESGKSDNAQMRLRGENKEKSLTNTIIPTMINATHRHITFKNICLEVSRPKTEYIDLRCFTMGAVRSMLNTIEANPIVFSTFSMEEIRQCRERIEGLSGERLKKDDTLIDMVKRFLETKEMMQSMDLKIGYFASMFEVSEQLIELRNKNLENLFLQMKQPREFRKRKRSTQGLSKQKSQKVKEKERLDRAYSLLQEYKESYKWLAEIAACVPTEDDPVEIEKIVLAALLLEGYPCNAWESMKAYLSDFGISEEEMEILYANRLHLGPYSVENCSFRILALQHLIDEDTTPALFRIEHKIKKL
jgi:hypothetical protein